MPHLLVHTFPSNDGDLQRTWTCNAGNRCEDCQHLQLNRRLQHIWGKSCVRMDKVQGSCHCSSCQVQIVTPRGRADATRRLTINRKMAQPWNALHARALGTCSQYAKRVFKIFSTATLHHDELIARPSQQVYNLPPCLYTRGWNRTEIGLILRRVPLIYADITIWTTTAQHRSEVRLEVETTRCSLDCSDPTIAMLLA